MITYREIATITGLIPGFSSENNETSIKDIKVSINFALDSLAELKKYSKLKDYAKILIELAESDIYSYEESLYDQDRIENFELLEDLINFIFIEFSKNFGAILSEKECRKVTKKATNVFFSDDEYGTVLDTKYASKQLIDFLINYLAGKFIVSKTSKKKINKELDSIRDVAEFVSQLDKATRSNICEKYTV